jgi:hypothetical protein
MTSIIPAQSSIFTTTQGNGDPFTYEVSRLATVLRRPVDEEEFVLHQCNGSLVLNQLAALPDASNFDEYVDEIVSDVGFEVIGLAEWNPATERYVPLN